MAEKDPRILAFLCNWCSYAGADLAGTSQSVGGMPLLHTGRRRGRAFLSLSCELRSCGLPFPGGRGIRGRGQTESKRRLRKQAFKRYPLPLALRAFPLHRGGGNMASSLRLGVSTSSAKERNTLSSEFSPSLVEGD